MEISKNRVNPDPAFKSGEPAGGRRYGGIDKDERQRQRRERLIAAALAVFGDQGYHASTVRDVCRRAELTSRYFYESFESMEALFEALYVQVSRELMTITVEVLARTPLEPEALAEAALRTFLEFVRDDPRRARVMLIDALNVGPGTQRLFSEANRDFATLIAGFMDTLFPDLGKHGYSPTLIGHGLVGANVRIATVWVEEKCATPLEHVLRNLLSIFVASIAHARGIIAQGQAEGASADTQASLEPATQPTGARKG